MCTVVVAVLPSSPAVFPDSPISFLSLQNTPQTHMIPVDIFGCDSIDDLILPTNKLPSHIVGYRIFSMKSVLTLTSFVYHLPLLCW
jgi:hypothetical protein